MLSQLKCSRNTETLTCPPPFWLSASLPDRTAACRRPLLQPASPFPFTELCHDVRKRPARLTAATPGTPEPIRRHAFINLRLPRWSRTAPMTFTVTGEHLFLRFLNLFTEYINLKPVWVILMFGIKGYAAIVAAERICRFLKSSRSCLATASWWRLYVSKFRECLWEPEI